MKKWEKCKTKARKKFSMLCHLQCHTKTNGIVSI